jgi:hypothetical protein
VKPDLFDGLIMVGLVLLAAGLYLYSPRLALVVIGALLMVAGAAGGVRKGMSG